MTTSAITIHDTATCNCDQCRWADKRVECRLTADEKMLFQAVLEVIDNGDGCAAGAEYGRKPWLLDHESEELANSQRLAFTDAIIDRLRVIRRC